MAVSPRNMAAQVPDTRVLEYLDRQKATKEWIEGLLSVTLFKYDDSKDPCIDLFKSLQNGVILCYVMLELGISVLSTLLSTSRIVFHSKDSRAYKSGLICWFYSDLFRFSRSKKTI